MENFCNRFRGLAATTDIEGMYALIRLRCKQWDCVYCAKKNREMWFEHLIRRLPDVSHSWSFITLTAHSHAHASGKTLEACKRGIDLLLKRMRLLGKISYVRVYEHHKSGAIHAHLIVAGLPRRVCYAVSEKGCKRGQFARKWFVGDAAQASSWALKSWLKKSAVEVGMGYMVDVSHIDKDIQKAIKYILKYMTKSLQSGIDEKGLRRIATSQDVGSPKPGSELSWSLIDHITPMDLAIQARAGRQVYDLSTKRHVTLDDFEDVRVYPPEFE